MTAACPACAGAVPAGDGPLGAAQQFSLPAIHCAACIGKIERGLASVKGITGVRVNLSLKRVSVQGPATPGDILSALTDLGYTAYPLDTEALSAARDATATALLKRMAVSGFAMMNVMLLSVAVWSGATDATRDLFHLISALIALPVVAYAAQPFFDNALSALRVGRLNMDVPISLAILLATLMSLYETLQSGPHAYFDAALSLTFFLLIGRYMDHQTRSAARSAARELAALEVRTAQRIDDTGPRTVRVSTLTVGDRILVATGARIPVDGRLLSPEALTDRSILTGESAAVRLTTDDTLQAGEVNLGAPLTLEATAVGEDTTLRRMAALVDVAENGRNSYTSLADRAAQVYAPAVHLLALFAFLGWWAATGDVRHALNIAIAVLIITCPCALGLAVPAVTTAAISRLFAAGYLVKHATALERLAETTHVVLDKTGTLTHPATADLGRLPAASRSVLLALAQGSDHPKSRALAAALNGTRPTRLTDLNEVPGAGIAARWQDRPVRLGRGDWIGADFDGLGLRIGTGPAIRLDTADLLRPDTARHLAALDLPAEILTGDSTAPAQAVAADLGLPVTANLRPDAKLARLAALSDAGERVLMIGDGLNDTAALAAAHASIAPASALEASRNAADVVALKDAFPDVPFILRIARATSHLSRQNFTIATLYNLIAIPVALAGFATPLLAALAMSLSSITVLLNSNRMRSVQ